MATFIKELELKKYNLSKSKSREWLKDIATEFLYVYITDTKKGCLRPFIIAMQIKATQNAR